VKVEGGFLVDGELHAVSTRYAGVDTYERTPATGPLEIRPCGAILSVR
jgi:hypothetical protein